MKTEKIEEIKALILEVMSENADQKIADWFEENAGVVAQTLTGRYDVASESYVDDQDFAHADDVPQMDDYLMQGDALTAMDWSDLGDQIKDLADGMPHSYGSRCSLGISVTEVVLKVLGDGDALQHLIAGIEEHNPTDDVNRLRSVLGLAHVEIAEPDEPAAVEEIATAARTTAWFLSLNEERGESGHPLVIGPFDLYEAAYAWANEHSRHGTITPGERP